VSASVSVPPAEAHGITAVRRAKIESALPDTKDFVDARELAATLTSKGDFTKAWEAALNERAKGKYVLFRGTVNDVAKDTFALAVTMLEVDPDSPFGAPKALMFHAKDIKGYDASKYAAGDFGAVLAKYLGGKTLAIGPGFDVVAMGLW
jgi:hypothetical protein